MTLEVLITRYGLVAIFIGTGLEGETVAVSGGLLAHQGLLPLIPVMIAALAGSFVADQAFFLLGRRFRDHPRIRRIAAKPGFTRAIALFERRPVGFIIGFRFLYGLRTISPIAIGTTQVTLRRFMALNALAAIVWAVLFVSVGYAFGHGIELLFGKLRSAVHLLAAIGAIGAGALLIAWLVGWWLSRLPKAAG